MINSSSQIYYGKDLEAMSFAKNYHKAILYEFLPYLGRTVAEVGAGIGSFSTLLLQMETKIDNLVAYEPSVNMFLLLKDILCKEKRAEVVNDYFGKEKNRVYDSILYINVLEHIEKEIAELTTARSSLVSGGFLLLFVPALPCLYSEFDKNIGHFRRYTKKNIIRLIQGAKFNIRKIRYFDIVGIIPWYINFKIFKKPMTIGCVSLYDKLIIPLEQLIETKLEPPIGRNILLVAQK